MHKDPCRNIDEKQLIIALRRGDTYAFREIYDHYFCRLLAHARRILKDDEEARDAVHDVFSALWTRRVQLEEDMMLSGFLYRSVRNQVLNVIRKKKNRGIYLQSLIAFNCSADQSTSEQIAMHDLQRLIDAEVARLPERMRLIFRLSRNNYLRHDEIAGALGISPLTVKKQISRAIHILRRNIGTNLVLFYLLYRFL